MTGLQLQRFVLLMETTPSPAVPSAPQTPMLLLAMGILAQVLPTTTSTTTTPTAALSSHGVFAGEAVRYARSCTHFDDILYHHMCINQSKLFMRRHVSM